MPKAQAPDQRERKPLSKLFAHIRDPEQRESLINAYEGLQRILDESLRREINKMISESLDKSDKEDIYNSQNMLAYLADQAGYRRALKKVLTLLP
jgi:cell fate (sporulation/competence/biofilm development) regulator YlbF (YheA/YmcA/DUF963 family)